MEGKAKHFKIQPKEIAKRFNLDQKTLREKYHAHVSTIKAVFIHGRINTETLQQQAAIFTNEHYKVHKLGRNQKRKLEREPGQDTMNHLGLDFDPKDILKIHRIRGMFKMVRGQSLPNFENRKQNKKIVNNLPNCNSKVVGHDVTSCHGKSLHETNKIGY